MAGTSRTCMTRGLIALMGLTTLLGGCGKALRDADRSRLTSVSIDPAPTIKNFKYFGGKGKAATVLGGVVAGPAGAALGSVSGAGRSEKAEMLDLMLENNIDIGQIMASELEKQLAVKSDFPPRVATGGDATFHFEIGYALASGPFSSTLKPELYVWASLEDKDGKILWKSYHWANDGLKGYKHQEYVENPELLREVLIQACGVVAKKMAKSL